MLHAFTMTPLIRMVFALQLLTGVSLALAPPQRLTTTRTIPGLPLHASTEETSSPYYALFQGEEEEMIPLVTEYIGARYEAFAKQKEDYQEGVCTLEDAKRLLQSLLPPVTAEELDDEVQNICQLIGQMGPENFIHDNNDDQITYIQAQALVQAIPYNSYWQVAGGRVVKELIMFDYLYTYYETEIPVLGDHSLQVLSYKLTEEEGSLVPQLNVYECQYIVALCSVLRGQPKLSDTDFAELYQYLRQEESWVAMTDTSTLDTIQSFLGYVWRNSGQEEE